MLIADALAQAASTDEAFVADGVLAEVVLPLCIFLIMVTMGMSLTGDDFRRIAANRRAVVVGVVGQLVLLPAIGFLVAWVFPLDPVEAVSIVLLAAAPGGTTSNLIVHAADADRALSVTLTSLSNMVVWITMPILLTVSFDVFDFDADSIDFPIGELVVSIAALTIVPVLLGMGIRRIAPALCRRVDGPSKIFAAAFLFVIVAALVVTNWDAVTDNVGSYAPAFIVLNLAALAVGFVLAQRAGLDREQSTTVSIEMGLQNSTLAITIATSVLGNSELAIIPGLYGVWMLFTGFAFAFALKSRDTELAPASP
ncbi:MAG: bile acid:sodium symporter family protein [Actinomycetota bacterium]